jgi:hypothetical protein
MNGPSVRYAKDVGTLEFDPLTGEGKIRFSEWFFNANDLTQADCLQDWIGLLTCEYDQLVAEEDFLDDHTGGVIDACLGHPKKEMTEEPE